MAVNPMLINGAAGIAQGIKSLDSVAQEIAELNIKSNPSENAGDGEAHPGFALDEMANEGFSECIAEHLKRMRCILDGQEEP